VQAAHQTRHRDSNGRIAAAPRKSADTITSFTFDIEGLVIALREQLRMQSPQLEQLTGNEQFLAAVPPIKEKIGW
jgi:hypothetical protein